MNVRTVLALSIAVFIGTYICNSVADPDLWWHITVGRWILSHAEIPSVDYWNTFGVGKPWRAYSWLTDVLFAGTDSAFGPAGLVSLLASFGCGLAATYLMVFTRLSGNVVFGASAGVFATAAVFNHFTLRPQVLVWIFCALALWCAESYRLNSGKKVHLLALAAIGCLWANVHLTAALGLIVVVCWLFERGRYTPLIQGSAAYVVGTLCTPYLGGEWITLAKKSGHPLRYQAIAEFQPATILQYSTSFLIIAVTIVICFLIVDPRRVRPGPAVCAAGFTVAGLAVVKFLPFAVMATLALAAVWLRDGAARLLGEGIDNPDDTRVRQTLGGIGEGFLRLSQRAARFPPGLYFPVAFVLLSLSTVKMVALLRRPLNFALTPVAAVDFLEREQLPHPVLNEFGAGGYLMYRFSNERGEPRALVPIDGRTNVNSKDAWKNYEASFLGKPEWRKFLEMTSANTVLWRRGSAFSSLLAATGEWCEVYRSGEEAESFVLFVKRGAHRLCESPRREA
jgi:hypothetical protein